MTPVVVGGHRGWAPGGPTASVVGRAQPGRGHAGWLAYLAGNGHAMGRRESARSLRSPRSRPRRQRGGHQGRLSPAGRSAPPRQEPGRPLGPRSLHRDQPGAPDLVGRRTSAAPTTATARRRFKPAGAAAAATSSTSAASTKSSATSWAPSASAAATAATCACRCRVTFEEAALGTSKEVRYQRTDTCGSCEGSGGEPGTRVETCSACGGRGRVRFQQALFPLAMERACSRCKGQRLACRPRRAAPAAARA